MDDSARLTVLANNLDTRRLVEIACTGGLITEIDDRGPASDTHDWVGPGLVDLQINGCYGLDFNRAADQPDSVERVSELVLRRGVTTIYPTLVTNSGANLTRALEGIAEACDRSSAVNGHVGGVNLEGPFISAVTGPRGAHDPRWLTPPSWDAFQRWNDASGGRIRIVTLAPELPGSIDFIERCIKIGVIPAIGHTAATPRQVESAVSAGARLSTHLGNGAHLKLPRHDNYVWEQLASDGLWASFIADGVHLPHSVLKVMLRAKGERAFVISDAVAAAGMPAGEYEATIGGRVRVVGDGRVVPVSDPRLLAGSATLLPDALRLLVESAQADITTAWAMCSTRPSALVGAPTARGVAVGAPADLVVFRSDNGLTVRQTIKAGQVVDPVLAAA